MQFAGELSAAIVLLTVAGLPDSVISQQTVALYSDVRNKDLRGDVLDLAAIRTLWFNNTTLWDPPAQTLASQVMQEGKNPGLGVRQLHAQGITGSGVTVAIIDQNMVTDHPEFAGKVVKYRDFNTGMPSNQGSMHGPAVASLLVGNSIGTAPGAKIYYAAVPSWLADAQYYTDALDWIISENRLLPAGQRIRAVSVSAAPSGAGSPFTKNNQSWDLACQRARAEGILVLDCTEHQGLISTAFYNPDSPEDVTRVTPGQPSHPGLSCVQNHVCAPNSPRTQAEEYSAGQYSYQYMGQGGLSWSIPYVTGVLAMGWQLKPDLTMDQIWSLLVASSHVTNGCNIINPPAFINQVKGASYGVWITHVTKSAEWKTGLSAYNAGSAPATLQLNKYNADGSPIGTTAAYLAAGRAWTQVAASDLAYEGTALVATDRPLLLKLSYQYGQSQSVCEFFLTSATGRNWVIPNPAQSWFSFAGIALTNPGDSTVTVVFEAWKNGTKVAQSSIPVSPRARLALLSNQIWTAVANTGFDTAVIRASGEIPSPIAITGNSGNDRHLFFAALPEPATVP